MKAEDPNQKAYDAKAQWHQAQRKLPIKEKMRILIELQKHDLPLIARQRLLKSWEKPWDIEP